MQIPARIPGLKGATLLLGVCFVLWIGLEGNISQTLLLAVLAALVMVGRVGQRRWGGRLLSPAGWLFISGGSGATIGLLSGGLTLILMAVKTGLHAHGPEFTALEINFVVGQIPLWVLVGLLGGVGLGLIGYALTPSD